MSKNFIKLKEDFVCEKCGQKVEGTGYTNHCPNCLWSRHVDIQPGDRASECCGMMRPSLEYVKGSEYTLKHTCVKCGHAKINKASKNDDINKIIELK